MFDVTHVAASARDAASETEQRGHLSAELATELVKTGITRAHAPTELGAPEATPMESSAALQELGRADGSAAWCAMISATTSLASGFLPPEWSEKIYGPAESITGGFAAPMGRARQVDGGLSVTGQWQWGSGSHNCTWLGGGALVVDDDGRPTKRADGLSVPFTFFEPDQFELLDTWHVSGLKGTGSTDYRVADAFVPEGRWFQIGGDPVRPEPMYRFPFYGALALGVSSVMLGLAARAIDELLDIARSKKPQGSSKSLAERAVVQGQLSEARAAHLSATYLLDRHVSETWAAAVAGTVPDRLRFDLRLATSHAAQASVRAVDLCYHAMGGAAVYDTAPIQRVFRDVHVAIQHAMVAPRTFEVLGREAFGLPTSNAQI